MNKQGENKISYLDFSWNPFVGCKNGCSYCWARKMANRIYHGIPFEQIQYFDERLNEPLELKKPARIGVGFMGDIAFVNSAYVQKMIDVCKQCPQHTFLFLSKIVDYRRWDFPPNCWLGWTYTGQRNSPLCSFPYFLKNRLWISLEPLLQKVKFTPSPIYKWCVIGAETCNGRVVKEHAPKREWVKEMAEECRKYKVPIFMKNNLKEIWGSNLIQEIPKEIPK